jgi:alcohol dehydrogenase class IV
VTWLATLKREIGIAPDLTAVGVKRDQIGRLVEVAEQDICHQTNPRPCNREDFMRFFDEAL